MVYTKELIKEIIDEWEGPSIEVKQGLSEKIGNTISAFANTFGGTIVLGLNPQKQVMGIDDADTASMKIRELLDRCSPRPHVNQESLVYEDKKLIVIKVEQIPFNEEPCFFNRKCFVRQGSTNLELYGRELIGFLKNRTLLNFEELKSRMKMNDIDTGALSRLVQSRSPDEEMHDLNTEGVRKMLFALRAANYNGEFYLKNIAAMFFAKDPQQFVPNLEARVVKYKSKEPELEAIASDKRINGTVPNLIEKAFIMVKEIAGTRFITKGLERIEIPEYPDKVIREMITNAIGHRDYFDSNDVLIELYPDRLQITNPGGLLQGQTILNFYKIPRHRNPLVYQFLHDLRYGEGLGTGVRKMINYMREAGLPDPEFHNIGDSFRVTIYNASSGKSRMRSNALNARQEEALTFLKANKSLKLKAYAELVGVSQPTATKDLNELITHGLVRRIGKFRGAYYVLDGHGEGYPAD
ncbi:MAG: putative DNA binding domain-containing protein [Candidatus Marsarchaeota archaeon]|jgi:ATP-dependent DNA helicase RecG|nr:putative DNA binding domain-containing protein [Candidatus Marsarchaeota archaeon]